MICNICSTRSTTFFLSKDNYDLFRCDDCSLIFVDPMPSDQEIDNFYNNYHKTHQYVDKSGSKVRRAKKRIKTIYKKAVNKTLLDVGCNIGAGAEAGRLLGFDSMGIDIDTKSIKIAQSLFPSTNYQSKSLNEIVNSGKRFGIVYCSEVIEHLPELNSFTQDLYEILDKNGILYITTPDIGHFSLKNNLEKIKNWDSIRPPEHLFYFNKNSIKTLLLKSGFKKVKFQFSFKPGIKLVAYK